MSDHMAMPSVELVVEFSGQLLHQATVLSSSLVIAAAVTLIHALRGPRAFLQTLLPW